MRVLILGAAGVLGSALTERFLKLGMKVRAMDVCRIDEAWRLAQTRDTVDYRWKASSDITRSDLSGIDVVIDSGIGVADRPLGNASPEYTLMVNVHPSLRLLEAVRLLPSKKRPALIYPSSFNALYGHANDTVYTSNLLPNPSSVYGWTKASVELLYSTYRRAYDLPTIICRVGSGYGPKMRSDELPARLILDVLRDKEIRLRSPQARRLWTYIADIIDFYERLIKNLEDNLGQTIHCAGNVGNETVTNMQLAKMIANMAGRATPIRQERYEPGELIDGKPISFRAETQSPLWRPKHTLNEGLSQTYHWFKENSWRYQ